MAARDCSGKTGDTAAYYLKSTQKRYVQNNTT